MGELGLFGCVVDPKYGGQGMDYLTYVIAVEELARFDGSQAATIAAHNSLLCRPALLLRQRRAKKQIPPRSLHRRRSMGIRINRTRGR